MGSFIDLTGRRFGRLRIISRAPNKGDKTCWFYECDCGADSIVLGASLRHADQRSCGCLQREAASRIGKSNATHGHTRAKARTPTYYSWRAMIERCTKPQHHAYARYGGRGIAVCDRWMRGDNQRSGFECFLADMGERPAGTSLDRIVNNGNYALGNCRWATRTEQARNTRAVKLNDAAARRLKAIGKTGTSALADAARAMGVSRAEAYRVASGRRWAL